MDHFLIDSQVVTGLTALEGTAVTGSGHKRKLLSKVRWMVEVRIFSRKVQSMAKGYSFEIGCNA